MKEKISASLLWHKAGIFGAVLGIATALCRLASMFAATRLTSPVLMTSVTFIIWLVQFAGCILLMRFFMLKLTADYDAVDNRTTYRFGIIISLLSAIVFSTLLLAIVLYVFPGSIEQQFNTVQESLGSMLDTNTMKALDNLKENYAVPFFFSNLIYCFVYGTVLSAILSANIPPRDPFAGYRKDDDNQAEQ